LIQDVSGCTQPVNVCRKAATSVPPARYVPSIDLAKKTLGLTLDVTLPEAIKKTLMWCLGQKNAQDKAAM
jgi:nucleoside-diphosphate-sugar epimerase